MKRYCFDMGDSFHGPVGFTAAVWAESEERATELLKKHLPSHHPADDYIDKDDRSSGASVGEGIEYITAYFNECRVSVDDACCDEEDDQEEEDSDG